MTDEQRKIAIEAAKITQEIIKCNLHIELLEGQPIYQMEWITKKEELELNLQLLQSEAKKNKV